MKLNFGQRLLLFVHWLLSLIGCIVAALLLIVPDTAYHLIDRAYAMVGKRTLDTVGIVLCAMYVLIAAGCAIMIFSGSAKRKERGLITVYSNETGKTRIAVSAVEQMTRQAISGVEGISDVKAAITGSEDAIGINISLVLKRGAYLPNVTANIQRTVRGYIEQNCGVMVHDIVVNVRAVEGDVPNAGKAIDVQMPAEAPVENHEPIAGFRADIPQEIKPITLEMPESEPIREPSEAPADAPEEIIETGSEAAPETDAIDE